MLLELFDGGLDLGVRGGAALEEIADFAKEHDVLGRGRGGGSGRGGLLLLFGLEKLGGFGLEALADGRDDLDEPEDHEGEQQELHDGREEGAVAEYRGAGLDEGLVGLGARVAFDGLEDHEEVREVGAADEHAEDRVDDVLDERVDDVGEGGADDHGDGEIHDVALRDECLEFLEKIAHFVSSGCGLRVEVITVASSGNACRRIF